MPYCNKCGKEIPEGDCCADCKIDNLNSKVEQNKKKNWMFLVIIGVVILLSMFLIFKSGNIINNDSGIDPCPYTCCKENSGFLVKPCPNLYECGESRCIAIDSDGDGLTDIREKELGTNPTNSNTDGDRYDDNVDPNPLTPNSAKIDINFISQSWDWKYGNIILAMIGGVIAKPDLIIAEPKATIEVTNIGDDHTDFVNFNMIFKISDTVISQKPISINKFNAGDTFQETFTQGITAGDIPDLLINLVTQQTNNWGIEIQNLNYEMFS